MFKPLLKSCQYQPFYNKEIKMFSWKNKADRKAAHALLEKAAGREFAAAKRRLAEQVEALENMDDVWALSKSAKEICKDFDWWYTSRFSDMDKKLSRHRNYGYLADEDFAVFSEQIQADFAQWWERCDRIRATLKKEGNDEK